MKAISNPILPPWNASFRMWRPIYYRTSNFLHNNRLCEDKHHRTDTHIRQPSQGRPVVARLNNVTIQ